MIIRSYSKINLSLRVLKKLKNGFHDIQSNSFLINLYDEIKILKIKTNKDKVLFKGNYSKFVKKKTNTVTKVLQILRSKKRIKDYYRVEVKKNIPVFSGLGGGTSNAFFLAKYLTKNNIDKNLKKNLVKKIGTDYELFGNKQTYQKRLSKIKPYIKHFNFYFVLIYPNLNCSTKAIYAKVKKFSKTNHVNFSNINSQSFFLRHIMEEKNDLQDIVIKKFPILKRIVKVLADQKKCKLSRMTGSGSTCFGLFNSHKSAKLALIKIKRKYPRFCCVMTKTI
jgi:4-diphosphocytidyl-2-C-methyl-D-erythritol kinase